MTVHEKKLTLSIIRNTTQVFTFEFFLSKSSEFFMPLFEWLKIRVGTI